MYKRPPIRPSETSKSFHKNEITRDSLLFDIVNPKPTQFHIHIKKPIFRYEDYINLYNRQYGIEKRVFDLPPEPIYKNPIIVENPRIGALDTIGVSITVLKSGKVRLKINTAMYELYEKYYKKNKVPPNKTLLKAYKSLGFSDVFMANIEKKLSQQSKISKIFGERIDKVFNKPTKKKKPEPEPEPDIEDDIGDDIDDDIEDDDIPGDDGELDIDIEPDDIEDPPTEEYFSDGD